LSCARITEAFDAGVTPEFEAHLKTCEECRSARAAYLAVGRASVAPPEPSRLEAARAAALKELQAQPLARPWWVAGAGLLAVDAVLAAALPFSMSLRADPQAWICAALWWAVAAGGTFAALMPGRAWTRWAALLSGALALAATFAGALGRGDMGGSSCAVIELGASVLPVVVTLAVLTRFAFDPLRAAVAGAAAAAVGVGVLCIHCPSTAFAHVAAFHVAPWLAVALAAAALRRMLPSRSLAP
jgi:hypothetical protein